eukprot:993935-Amphidinium_carterae.2
MIPFAEVIPELHGVSVARSSTNIQIAAEVRASASSSQVDMLEEYATGQNAKRRRRGMSAMDMDYARRAANRSFVHVMDHQLESVGLSLKRFVVSCPASIPAPGVNGTFGMCVWIKVQRVGRHCRGSKA